MILVEIDPELSYSSLHYMDIPFPLDNPNNAWRFPHRQVYLIFGNASRIQRMKLSMVLLD